jgi:hypothetical protein
LALKKNYVGVRLPHPTFYFFMILVHIDYISLTDQIELTMVAEIKFVVRPTFKLPGNDDTYSITEKNS